MPQNINCPNGCPPSSTGIGTAANTVVWIYTEGNGSITDVSGLPDPPFSNGRTVGQTYKVDYAGENSQHLSWSYTLTSDPACPDKELVDPVLTNGPGNQ